MGASTEHLQVTLVERHLHYGHKVNVHDQSEIPSHKLHGFKTFYALTPLKVQPPVEFAVPVVRCSRGNDLCVLCLPSTSCQSASNATCFCLFPPDVFFSLRRASLG